MTKSKLEDSDNDSQQMKHPLPFRDMGGGMLMINKRVFFISSPIPSEGFDNDDDQEDAEEEDQIPRFVSPNLMRKGFHEYYD